MHNRKLIPIMVRLPEDLHAEVTAMARQDERSLNSLFILLVKDALALRRTLNGQRDRPHPQPVQR